MSTLTALHGFGRGQLRASLHLPPIPQQRIVRAPLQGSAGWLERLARWAERQPMHHRLGSYTALR